MVPLHGFSDLRLRNKTMEAKIFNLNEYGGNPQEFNELESNVLMYRVFLIHDYINENVVYAITWSLMASTLILMAAKIAFSQCYIH